MKLKIFSTILTLMLSGCALDSEEYAWSKYEESMSLYYKKESSNLQKQISNLEDALAKLQDKPNLTPPGMHAQLGLLYSQIGNEVKAKKEFEIEKSLFKESSSFTELLLNNKGRIKND